MIEIGKKIRELRKQCNLTQQEVADALFVSQDTVSLWECEKIHPSLESLVVLCDLFDVSADELLGRVKW